MSNIEYAGTNSPLKRSKIRWHGRFPVAKRADSFAGHVARLRALRVSEMLTIWLGSRIHRSVDPAPQRKLVLQPSISSTRMLEIAALAERAPPLPFLSRYRRLGNGKRKGLVSRDRPMQAPLKPRNGRIAPYRNRAIKATRPLRLHVKCAFARSHKLT